MPAGWAWAGMVAIAVRQTPAKPKLTVLLSITTVASFDHIYHLPSLTGWVLDPIRHGRSRAKSLNNIRELLAIAYSLSGFHLNSFVKS